ncbi:MAG TPA: hypothetical protein VN877_04350 [Opitutaceae bacterium]|nr:hypothetical protein [Opitutaceae bacterium]
MRFVLLFAAFVALILLALPRSVLAANPREIAALDALNQAESDYLGMNYAAGAARLDKALRVCAPANCSSGTQAALLRDIGTMELRAGDKAFAIKAFGEALKLHPTIDLNPSYDSPDVRALWEEVKGGGAPSASPVAPAAPAAPSLIPLAPAPSAPAPPPAAPAPPPAPLPVAPPPVLPQPAKGDFVHTPAAEQKIDTPLPIFIEGGPADTYHVIVRYKLAKERDDVEWSHVDLTHLARGWGGLIPCNDIVLGTMRYYIQAYNKDMDPVGGNGDAKNPYQVPLRPELAGPPPHLPNKNPPKACHGKSKAGAAPPKEAPETETSVAEGGEAKGEEKEKHEAKPGVKEPLRRWWVGVGLHFDFLEMPQGIDLCRVDQKTTLPLNADHIFCYAPSLGTDFPAYSAAGSIQNSELQSGTAGTSAGGIVLANLRFFASLEYAFNANILAGVRLGYVLLRYPGTQAVADGYGFGSGVYLEARATAVIGKDALSQEGFAPVAFAGVGVSAFDGHTSGTATLCPTASAACAGVKPTPLNVDMWWTNGPAFIDFGGGLRYAPAPRLGLIGALRVNLSIGNNGLIPTVGPEISGQMGF